MATIASNQGAMGSPNSSTPKRRGRPLGTGGPRLTPENATKPRSMRLNDARWEKLQRLGRQWLEDVIDGASG